MPDTELTGDPDGKPHRDIDPETGQQRAYVVLSEEERAKGFVEPLRMSYVHVGPPEPKNLRDLTEAEKTRYAGLGYVKFEEYDDQESPVRGKFWTQSQLNRLGGCGAVTSMTRSIAETYARKPNFYSETFCSGCKKHLPLNEFIWEKTSLRVGSQSTKEQ